MTEPTQEQIEQRRAMRAWANLARTVLWAAPYFDIAPEHGGTVVIRWNEPGFGQVIERLRAAIDSVERRVPITEETLRDG